ncbi:hypothetical protein PSH77_14090 [Pseudomonas extremorientalis]|uniref:hypothetical protein n=1 Tax=Pseudomonas extremorientalis TaxID=169669 RepID=UPI002733E64B|nr:hypothetical protein [Pseudomonas extremorientalis]WLG59614.1 hypothetical protein PSH77_14090 [Pseudomonas extremorientalis]
MLDELQASKSCYFYRQKSPITAAAVTALFRAIRAGQTSPSNNFFSYTRQAQGASIWSALCFQFDKTPSFLPGADDVIDRVTGYLLIIEHRDHVAIFKSQIDVTADFAKRHLQRIGAQEVDRGLTSKDSVFARVRLRHMTLSRFALRSKTLEGENLQNNVGMASSARFAPLGYSFTEADEHFSTTPRTGRISLRADRAGYLELVDYACSVIDRLHPRPGRPTPSPFLAAFARPLELSDLTANITQFAVDTAILGQAIFDDKVIRLVKCEAGAYRELMKEEIDPILAELTEVLAVTKNANNKLLVSQLVTGAEVGEISINKTRIALKRLTLPLLANVYVEETRFAVGADEDRVLLKQFIDKHDTFIILFDQPRYAYLDGNLYQDNSFVNGGTQFLGYLFENAELAIVTDEKGSFSAAHHTFDADSTFGAVLSTVAREDDVIVCDDLGDEWADFIGFQTNPASPRVTFYHAKHGDLTLGASAFHVSVSQAIKNLGNLNLPTQAMTRKFASWNRFYKNDGIRTRIHRTCRGTTLDSRAAVEFCRNAPHTFKRVAIVTSSLSKAAVQQAFTDIEAGHAADPYFVQLYWLLSSFFAACTEVGAFGCVICQE